MIADGDQENADDRPALRRDDLVDVIALRGQQEGAAYRPETLDRHRDGDDRLAFVVDADDRLLAAAQARASTSG